MNKDSSKKLNKRLNNTLNKRLIESESLAEFLISVQTSCKAEQLKFIELFILVIISDQPGLIMHDIKDIGIIHPQTLKLSLDSLLNQCFITQLTDNTYYITSLGYNKLIRSFPLFSFPLPRY